MDSNEDESEELRVEDSDAIDDLLSKETLTRRFTGKELARLKRLKGPYPKQMIVPLEDYTREQSLPLDEDGDDKHEEDEL